MNTWASIRSRSTTASLPPTDHDHRSATSGHGSREVDGATGPKRIGTTLQYPVTGGL